MAKKEENKNDLMNKIVSLCKRRGFIYPGSEIYGGLAGTFDYGPLGTLLKNNIRDSWINYFVKSRDNMYLIDTPILMHPRVWEASGHVENFVDPIVECDKCKKRFREDQIEDKEKCADCGGKLSSARNFNLMLETKVGASDETAIKTFLRPEEAQSMFINFKNIMDSFSPKIPFGIAQMGKAFRNEITPRDFVYRMREFEIMEFEYFIHPDMPWEA
ncbi:MAG: glycine--tRNA ligase, partial [Candidatus Paceibacterota bacterium]